MSQTKLKSFNPEPPTRVIRTAIAHAAAAVITLFAAPHALRLAIVPCVRICKPILNTAGVRFDFPEAEPPEWGALLGPIQAAIDPAYGVMFRWVLVVALLLIAASCALEVFRIEQRKHDGTWLGPKRVPGHPGGSAYLVSRHSKLKKVLKPWDGESAPERSGLPVAYFDEKFWMLDYINLLIYGAPGCGKTRRVLIPAVCAHIMAGDSVFCLDPKGEIGDYTEDFAKENDYRVIRVMVDDPMRSPDTVNPLDMAISYAKEGNIDDAVAEVAGIAKVICPTKSKSNPHFDDSARTLCEGLMLAVITSPDIPDDAKSLATMNAIVSFAGSDGTTGLDRIRKMARGLPNDHPAKSKLSQVANTGDEEAGSIISTFTNKLNDYVDARVSKMLWKSSFNLEDMAREKTVVYLSFTSANGNYGKLVTTLVANAISALRREAARQGGHLVHECYLILEEMAQMERIETIYTDAGIMRGEGIHMLLVLQEKSQLLTKYSREEAASLTGCCDDTLVLSVNELEVAKELSGKIGTYPALMHTQSESWGSRGGVSSGTRGETTSSQKRELITPDEMLKWGPEIGNLLIGHGGTYAMPSPGLEDTFVNERLGLGDRPYNDRLRARKKAERPVLNSRPAPIWLPDAAQADGAGLEAKPMRTNYNPLRL